MNRTRMGLILLAIAALAVPAVAIANEHGGKASEHSGKASEHSGKAKGKGHGPHNVGYVFKGTYVGGDAESIEVEVERGNFHVRKGEFIGKTVSFEILESTRIVARDTSGDGERNLADVQEGDWVLVKAMLPRNEPGEPPFAARKLIDKTSFQH